nr:hypothetical protein [Tanacetum cinerariifolium]
MPKERHRACQTRKHDSHLLLFEEYVLNHDLTLPPGHLFGSDTGLLNVGLHYKLDIANDVPVLTHIQLLLTLGKTHWYAEWLESGLDIKLLESHGGLILLGRYCTHPHQLNIYEMSCECSEWSLKYFVNLDDIMLPLYLWKLSWFRCIVFGEQNEDSFMVIESDERLFNTILYQELFATSMK